MTEEDKNKLEYVCSNTFHHSIDDLLKDIPTDEKRFLLEWYYELKKEGAFDNGYNEPFDLTFKGFVDDEGHFHPDENKQVTFHNCRFADTNNDVTISIKFNSDYEQV